MPIISFSGALVIGPVAALAPPTTCAQGHARGHSRHRDRTGGPHVRSHYRSGRAAPPAAAATGAPDQDRYAGAWIPPPSTTARPLPNPDVPLEMGNHDLQASWGGDTHYNPGDPNVFTVAVTKTAPAPPLSLSGTVLTTGENPSSLVVRTPADATRTVTFYSDINQVLGRAPIQDGYAILTSVSATLPGIHPLSASYPGDAHYNSGQSNTVVVTVSNPVSSKE